MASTSNVVDSSLPQQMEQHTYSIMYEIEGTHWWFAGRRQIISGFIERICKGFTAVREFWMLAVEPVRTSKCSRTLVMLKVWMSQQRLCHFVNNAVCKVFA
jgi:hypothetical protein